AAPAALGGHRGGGDRPGRRRRQPHPRGARGLLAHRRRRRRHRRGGDRHQHGGATGPGTPAAAPARGAVLPRRARPERIGAQPSRANPRSGPRGARSRGSGGFPTESHAFPAEPHGFPTEPRALRTQPRCGELRRRTHSGCTRGERTAAMKTLRLARAELTRHKGFLPILAVLFLVIVPCLYGALYLWSNWDPYGTLEDVPVAVVNQDEPVKVEGKKVDAGDQLVDQMQADPIFGWQITDAEDAAEGLADGRYYMTITIPEDFSASLASGADGTPRKAQVEMRRNDSNGYVVGIMAESVQAELHQQINSA